MVASTHPVRDRAELRFVQRIASDAWAAATALNATNSHLPERHTQGERGSDFDGSRRIRRIRGSFRLENRLSAASNAFVIVSIGDEREKEKEKEQERERERKQKRLPA